MKYRILVVDDELSMREYLSILLEREGYEAVTAGSAADALDQVRNGIFDLVISDVQMPGLTGIELLARIKECSLDTAVLMVTAYTTADQAVEAMRLGAYDYISKPFKNDEIKILIRNALEKSTLQRENRQLRNEISQRDGYQGMIGTSARMREVYDLISKVAPSTSSVLISGESGTGKELAARAIHRESMRKNKPFVAVNCGAIPDSLIESELFGHKKGAFTGAVADRPGLFEQAEGGTLFLDEIGELPLLMQTKLLRVLQEKEFRRVGDAAVHKTDVRLLTASNRKLEEMVGCGAFREDLYYRINVVQIALPPLRERLEDIPLLVDHFIQKCNPSTSVTVMPDAIKVLMGYSFPGNIRELENIVERSLLLDHEIITAKSLPEPLLIGYQTINAGGFQFPDAGVDLESLLADLEKKYLLKALERSCGVKKKAAELLGMTFRSFRYRLAKFGLDDEGE